MVTKQGLHLIIINLICRENNFVKVLKIIKTIKPPA